jgi:hypothetical protein
MNFKITTNSNLNYKLNLIEVSRNIIEYILALFIVLNCNSIFERKMYIDYRFPELILIFSLLLFIILIFQIHTTRKFIKKFVIFLIILFIHLTIFAIVNLSYDKMISFIFRFVVFIPCMTACFYLYKVSNKQFSLLYKISNIIYLLGSISLVMWFLCSVLNLFSPNVNTIIDWGEIRLINGYWNIYFETQNISFFSYSGLRNTGIFTEAPMFSLCLIISLLIEMFIRTNVKNHRIIILLIIITTTFSTTGLICSLIMVFLKFSFSRKRKTKMYILINISLIIITIIIIIYIIIIMIMYKSNTGSYSVRIDDYIAGFKAWADHPIFGNGYGTELAIQQYMSGFRSDNLGFSNSIMNVLAQSGLWLFLAYIVPFCLYIRYSNKKKYFNIAIVGIMIFVLFFTTIFQDRFILLVFMSLGYSFIFD